MSIQKFFRNKEKTAKKQKSVKDLVSKADQAESVEYLLNYERNRETYLPPVDYNDVENIARYSSAGQIYEKSIIKIYEEYPYDGTLAEKLDWENSNSFLERHIFENEYPRNNGHIRLSAGDTWTKNSNAALSTSLYGMPTNKEYIEIKGGPHTSLESNIQSRESYQFGRKAGDNFLTWDKTTNTWLDMRKSNLYSSGTTGNTIEFWFKRDSSTYNSTTRTKREVVFDMWNQKAELTAGGITFPDGDYGRIRIEYLEESNKPLFYFTYLGPSKNTDSQTDPGITVGVVDIPLDFASARSTSFYESWHHVSISAQNNEKDLDIYLHIDGVEVEKRKAIGQAVAAIPAPHLANIGALSSRHELEYNHWTLTKTAETLSCAAGSGRHDITLQFKNKEDNNTPAISRRPLIAPGQKRENSKGILSDDGTTVRKVVDTNALFYTLKVYVKNIPEGENLEFPAANADGTLAAADSDGWKLMTNRTLSGANTPQSYTMQFAGAAGYPLARFPTGEYKFVAEAHNSIGFIANVAELLWSPSCP